MTSALSSVYYQKDISHYNKEVNIIHDLDQWKIEIQNYCERDCIALYEILVKFREMIYFKFIINIDYYPTTPSLSFAIFRTTYLMEKTIPLFKGKIMDFLRESYSGGSVDVYKPYGKNLYWYDVNSLYPYNMLKNKFPTGEVIQFQGDIEWIYKLDDRFKKEDTYWIGDADVKTKKDLYIPYLQINHISNLPKRTISPNGSFTMKINSPEYYNALKDYNFEINSGFLFEASDIFSKYVDD